MAVTFGISGLIEGDDLTTRQVVRRRVKFSINVLQQQPGPVVVAIVDKHTAGRLAFCAIELRDHRMSGAQRILIIDMLGWNIVRVLVMEAVHNRLFDDAIVEPGKQPDSLAGYVIQRCDEVVLGRGFGFSDCSQWIGLALHTGSQCATRAIGGAAIRTSGKYTDSCHDV